MHKVEGIMKFSVRKYRIFRWLRTWNGIYINCNRTNMCIVSSSSSSRSPVAIIIAHTPKRFYNFTLIHGRKKTVVSFVHFTFKSCFLSTFKLLIPGVSWCYWVKMPYKFLSKSINVSDARLMQEWSHEDRTNHTMCAYVSQIYSQLCPLNWSLI